MLPLGKSAISAKSKGKKTARVICRIIWVESILYWEEKSYTGLVFKITFKKNLFIHITYGIDVNSSTAAGC